MIKVERETEMTASPEEVYEVVMDPQRLEDWVTIHHHLIDAPSGTLEKGSKLTQCLKLAGNKFKVRWEVVENDPCERVVWEGKGPMRSHARAVYEFSPNENGGTSFSYRNEYDLPGGPLGKMAGPAVKKVTSRELDGSLKKLKKLVE